jgi:terminase large subunit-like protein
MAMTATAEQPEPGVFLPRKRRFFVGCDLGQQNDATALCVVEKIDGVVDYNSATARHCGYTDSDLPQKPVVRYDCRYLQRLPLKLSYPDQVARVKALMLREPLCGVPADNIARAELVVDATGVGLPVFEMFKKAGGLDPIGATITSSEDKATYSNSLWHVSKALLVQNLDALLHQGLLRFAKGLAEAGQMEVELKDFRRFVSAAGRSTWEARSGQHDDLVLAVAIALWWASRGARGAVGWGMGRY